MKRISPFIVLLCSLSIAHAQNIGIGTTSPKEKLDVNGAIKIAGTNSANPSPGTIRWNTDKNDFEGYNGTTWVSLTGGKSQWGDLNTYSYENGFTNELLGNNGKALATGLASYGDILTAGVGLNNHAGVSKSGSFYMYKKENGIWKIFESVSETTPVINNEFGMNVAMNANFVVVSAAGANANGNANQGKLVVYTYNNTGATYSTTLTAADGYVDDYFGSSLAMHDNLIIAGAPSNDILFNDQQGNAYIFKYNGSTWQEVANLSEPGSHPFEQLGWAVAIHGNYAVASSKSANINGQGIQGKVCVFQYNGSSWVYQTTLTSPLSGPNQYYGYSVSLSGDTLVVGATESVNNNNGKGKVYVYIRNGNAWNLQATLSDPDGHENDEFGSSVHINNGLLIVGAPNAWVGGARQGKSVIYKPTAQGWSLQAALTASKGQQYDEFGSVVHINEHTAFCSAPNTDVGSVENNGRVYFFKRSN